MPETPIKLPEKLGQLICSAKPLCAAHSTSALPSSHWASNHHTIMNLVSDEAQTQISLANRTQTDRTTMVRIVDELEQYGLVTRQTNPEDRRKEQE